MDAPLSLTPPPEMEFEALVRWYAQRRPARAAGLTDLAQGRAALLAGVPECGYLCDGEGRTPTGVDVLAALIVMEGMGCAAFGLEGEHALRQYDRLAPYATVPLLGAGELPGLGSALTDPDVIPCASGTEARFITRDVDVGEALRCGPELVEEILEREDSGEALKIAVLDEDDLLVFAQAQYAIRDALCLWSDVPQLFEKALRLYQGRAFWDGTGDLEPDFLAEMSRKYGLILL